MGILVFDGKLKADIQRVKEYAERNKHWYDPKAGKRAPGDNKKHVLKTGTHTVVFSWTRMEPTKVFRHMSMSTGKVQGKFPQVVSVCTMAHLLGFTGTVLDDNGLVWHPIDKWQFHVAKEENCIVVVQEI